jgi:PAS domain S-box-containing protein
VLTLKPSAAVLQTRTEALGSQYQVLRARATFLRDAFVHARALGLARLTSPADVTRERKLRADLTNAAERSAALQASLVLTGSSPAARGFLADAAGAESRLAGVLLEALDYLELGDFAAADKRLGGADTSRMAMVRDLDESQRLGLLDLVARERLLVRTANRIANAVVIWLVLGAILLVLAMLLVRRRFYVPLAAIDRGLARVALGELEAELPVQREDELGRLTAHFNQMTGVLRARSEEELRRRTNLVERFGRILDQSFNEIYVVDATTLRIAQANRGAQAALGYTAEQLAEMSLLDVVPDLDETGLRELVRPLRAGTQPQVVFTATHRRRDGSRYPVEINLQLWVTEDSAVFVAIAQDATERRRREALQVATQHISESALTAATLRDLYAAIHATIAELMPARNFYIALHDAENDLITFPYFVDEYDQPPEPKRPGRGLTEYVLRTGRPLLGTPEVFEALVRHGEVEPAGAPSLDWLGVPLVAGDRTIGVLVVQSYAEGVRYEDVELNMLKFVSTQVAMAIARKRSAEALRASETKYRSLVEHAAHGICRSTFDGRFVAANPALVKMLGYGSEAELLGLEMGTELYMDAEERRRLVTRYREAEHIEGIEVQWKRKDGKPITVRLSGRPLHDEAFDGFEMMV